AAVPGVRAAAPVTIFHSNYLPQQPPIRGFAVDPDKLVAANADMTASKAQIAALKATRAGVLVPSTVAALYGWKVGQKITLKSFFWANRDGTNNWPLDIVGIYPTNKD